MDSIPIHKFLAPKGESLEPPQSSKPITASSYELCPGFIAMVWDQSFFEKEDENPYTHLQEFEQLCSCLHIAGMTHETIKWKLFLFSLFGRAKQWYAHTVGGVHGNWDELRDKFCLSFFPLSRIAALRIEILTFQRKENETLGAAWARFTNLINAGLNLSLSDNILLHHFHLGLSKEVALHLDISSGGSFMHKTISEGKAILEKILENTPYTSTYDEFPEEVESGPDQLEEAHATESKIPSNLSHDLVAIEHPIKGMHHTLKDDKPHPSSFPVEFKEEFYEDFGNVSNLPVQVRPLTHSAPSKDDDGPHNKSFLMEHIKGLSAIMSCEWLAKMELSTKVAQIIAPSDILLCTQIIAPSKIEAHYIPTVGMNITSKDLANKHCPNESLIPSHKLLRIPTGVTLESYVVIRSIPLRIRGFEYRLDFHIYYISDTSLLVGLPFGTLFQERPK
jgi:hypothetical protein